MTIVGSIASRLTEKGSGISLSAGSIGTAAAVYVAGACIGALFFGQLTDRFGRKKLFIITLAVYFVATAATAFAWAPWYFFLCRFFTGAGIGGEYSAINSAIDELIPARVRGRVDLMINGSYWVGSAAGAAAAIFFLSSVFPKDIGWRVTFGLGAVLALSIMFVRRNVPESPRWLFIHGREEEAERIVRGIEAGSRGGDGEELEEVDDTIEVRQRESIPFRTIGRDAFKLYPKRADPRARALRRPGVPLQRRHVQPRHAVHRLLRRLVELRPGLHHRLRARQLPRAAAARPRCSTRSAGSR